LLAILIVSVVATPGGLALADLGSDPWSMFAKGIGRYVERRADIPAIQDWLGTLDPSVCRGQVLRDEAAAGAERSDIRGVPVPPSLARLDHRRSSLLPDDAGRPSIRIPLGGGGFLGLWGVTVGLRDMPAPPSDYSEHGEQRYPMAPGAYVWYAE
jgi:hypothetical protein